MATHFHLLNAQCLQVTQGKASPAAWLSQAQPLSNKLQWAPAKLQQMFAAAAVRIMQLPEPARVSDHASTPAASPQQNSQLLRMLLSHSMPGVSSATAEALAGELLPDGDIPAGLLPGQVQLLQALSVPSILCCLTMLAPPGTAQCSASIPGLLHAITSHLMSAAGHQDRHPAMEALSKLQPWLACCPFVQSEGEHGHIQAVLAAVQQHVPGSRWSALVPHLCRLFLTDNAARADAASRLAAQLGLGSALQSQGAAFDPFSCSLQQASYAPLHPPAGRSHLLG